MKKFGIVLIVVLSCFVYSFSFSQSNWIVQGGGTSPDEAYNVALDGSGNSYSCGYFTGNCTFGTNPSIVVNATAISDIFVSKTDASGTVKWVLQAGGLGPDRALAIAADSVGNSYVTGYFHGTISFGKTILTAKNSSQDMFVVKIDPNGNPLWAKKAGGNLGDIGNGIAVDKAGNVIVTGQFSDTAKFENTTLISVIDPSNSLPSFDVFTAKYDSDGNLLWVKAGQSKYTDRGLDVAVDNNNNIYVTGQFSDTITFDNVYNNNAYNAIFLIKYNANGAEQWIKQICGGTQNLAYGIAVDKNSNVFITGDFLSNLIFFGKPNYVLKNANSNYYHNIFIAKFDMNGTLLWATADGSVSHVSSRNIALDALGNPYIVGNFKCTFGDYADLTGEGTFNSVGFQDIFFAKYDANGKRIFVQQIGGQLDDNGNGIIINSKNEPILAGSFSKKIVFPSNSLKGGTVISGSPSPISYCNDGKYNIFNGLVTKGNFDIFVANAIDFTRQPYDYYTRTAGICNRPFVGSCINLGNYENQCRTKSPAFACTKANLYASSNTANQETTVGSVGPDQTYLWSTGNTTRAISTTKSGSYAVTVTTADKCYTSKSSLDITIDSTLAKPNITDDKGINKNSTNPTPITICKPNKVLLTGGGYGTYYYNWTGRPVGQDTLTVSASGWYTFNVKDSSTCSNSTQIYISVNTVGSTPVTVIPKSYLIDKVTKLQSTTDTVKMCSGDYFTMFVYDSITNPTGLLTQSISASAINWSSSPNLGSGNGNSIKFYPIASGRYKITTNVITGSSTLCGGSTKTFTTTKTIEVIIYPKPTVAPIIEGNQVFCQGLTTQLWIKNNPGYSLKWYSQNNGGTIIGDNTKDTVVVNKAATYYLTAYDTVNGCSNSAYSNNLVVTYKPGPPVTMLPNHGVICPKDSVMLVTTGGIKYEWQGPNGAININNGKIFVNTPGYYYCIVTEAQGCVLTSNTVEAKQYTTPFLFASPSSNLCPGGSVDINAGTNTGSIITWQSPLSGNSTLVKVTSPGTYICQVTSCNIVTSAKIVITQSNNFAKITPSGPTTSCKLDSIILYANSGMANYLWIPSYKNDTSLVVKQPGKYVVIETDYDGCNYKDSVNITVSQLPDANYTYKATGLKVDFFYNFGVNLGKKFYWNFGDGNYSNVMNPSNTYKNGGYYNVCLTVLDTLTNCQNTYCNNIKTDNPPIACLAKFDFTIKDSTVTFADSSLGNPDKWNWDFGDATTSNSQNPVHTYKYNGFYTVKLTVYNSKNNCMNVYTKQIEIKNINDCYADFSYYLDAKTNTASFTSLSKGNFTEYLWDFGDGVKSTETNPKHKYKQAGVYNTCLTVFNKETACNSIKCLTIKIDTTSCVADFIYTIDSTTKTVHFFDRSTGNPNLWYWEFVGGKDHDSTKNPTYTYKKDGIYKVHLHIWNHATKCNDHIEKLVNINAEQKLKCSFGYVIDTTNQNKSTQYKVTFLPAVFGSPSKYVWEYGDGTKDSSQISPSHIYYYSGIYNVCLYVSDYNIFQSDFYCAPVTIFDKSSINENNTNNSIKIIPNPAIDKITISGNYKSENVILYDIIGKYVEYGKIKIENNTIDVSKLSPGIYFIEILTNQGTVRSRFVKQ